jgi:uncharacterized protein (DUF2249 family)
MAVKNRHASTEAADSTRNACDELADVLARTTLALGRAGRPAQASRLAAAGYAAVRRERSAAAQRLNAAMHTLARMPDQPMEVTLMADTTLDVRTEPPARRHELIFDTFAQLSAGDGFELVNDHDPKPLYYQLEAEQTGRFSWDYVEQGPEVWRVRIGRTA